MTEDEMVGWHHRLNGHKFEQIQGDGERQGSLVCCSPWGLRVRRDGETEQQRMSLQFLRTGYVHQQGSQRVTAHRRGES